MTVTPLNTEVEEIALLYKNPEDKTRDEQEGVIGYRAVRSIVVGGSYYMIFAENWGHIWENPKAKLVYLRIFNKISEMMKPQNVWEGTASKIQDYFPELGKSIIYESIKWLKDNDMIFAIDRRRFFVNPDLVWKGAPALMGRSPVNYRFAQKPYGWERWGTEAKRATINCEWYEDDAGTFWRLD